MDNREVLDVCHLASRTEILELYADTFRLLHMALSNVHVKGHPASFKSLRRSIMYVGQMSSSAQCSALEMPVNTSRLSMLP